VLPDGLELSTGMASGWKVTALRMKDLPERNAMVPS
jgi:hypothetical protein